MAAAGLVAVATAAEYSGPVASGGNLSVVNCGPNSGAGPGPGPGSWSRSLDRALEEAAVTGVLSLSGRKLREFPRGAANHDLTDTTRAGDLPNVLAKNNESPPSDSHSFPLSSGPLKES
uniref:Leucine rich repeats and calponin homology domain containing 3 n=1 Tax=Balaenoptera musculus TaxID=9771 RepID=A0A8C0CKD1_BALMU